MVNTMLPLAMIVPFCGNRFSSWTLSMEADHAFSLSLFDLSTQLTQFPQLILVPFRKDLAIWFCIFQYRVARRVNFAWCEFLIQSLSLLLLEVGVCWYLWTTAQLMLSDAPVPSLIIMKSCRLFFLLIQANVDICFTSEIGLRNYPCVFCPVFTGPSALFTVHIVADWSWDMLALTQALCVQNILLWIAKIKSNKSFCFELYLHFIRLRCLCLLMWCQFVLIVLRTHINLIILCLCVWNELRAWF